MRLVFGDEFEHFGSAVRTDSGNIRSSVFGNTLSVIFANIFFSAAFNTVEYHFYFSPPFFRQENLIPNQYNRARYKFQVIDSKSWSWLKLTIVKLSLSELVLIGWNLIISILVWRVIRHYHRLVKGTSSGNLEKILENILKQGKLAKSEIREIKKQLRQLKEVEQGCFQRVGLIRFNPFSDLGGDQSFSLAILDNNDRGLVITGLHGRQTTRVYAKLLNGKKAVKLSSEEQLAIKKAIRRREK